MIIDLSLLALVALLLAAGWIDAEFENRELRDELAIQDALFLPADTEELGWPAGAALEPDNCVWPRCLGAGPREAECGEACQLEPRPTLSVIEGCVE